MHMDVVDLREFYARPLGGVVRRLLQARIRARWRNVEGLSVFGIGYAVPYLSAFRDEAARVGAFMPAAQGVIAWPVEGKRQTVLADEVSLPLPDTAADRLLLVHALENTESLRAMLRECWRILAPSGRILLVVPNRRGLWAQLDTTPFGHGQPYSRGQLARLLRDAMFSPIDWAHALYMPPVNWQLLLRSAVAWERLGAILWPAFSGVLIVEATKQVYALTPERETQAARGRFATVPSGAVAQRESRKTA
ncbi:MAG: methyltransferase domain-containing protein [Alphaproteobacteria bacterium]|nr:MAG: methyltransferase domain-containing protein [Alphaproteobacteria bacterium]